MTASIEEEKNYYNMFDYSDIVLSHCPPSSTLSMVDNKENIGSKELLNYINKHNPKLLICGHVHESTGVEIIGETLCINTATEVNLLEVDLEDVKNYKITKI
jgi:Icc-related predicted phosphoesterase